MRTRHLSWVLACSLVVLLAAPVGAAQTDSEGPTAAAGLSSTSLPRGEAVTLEGAGWQPDSTVRLESWTSDDVLSEANVDRSGEFRAQAPVPADAPTGRHTLRVTGIDASGDVAVVQITGTVTNAPAEASVLGGLATADGRLTIWGALVLLVMVVGVGVVVAERRLAPGRSSQPARPVAPSRSTS